MYTIEMDVQRRLETLRHDVELALAAADRRRRPERRVRAGDQTLRPAPAQYGARIVRLSSLPAWSRGSSPSTKSTDRGRL